MVLRNLRKHLRLVIVVYVFVFLVIMYFWRTSSVPSKTIHDKSRSLFMNPAFFRKIGSLHSANRGDISRLRNLTASANGSDPYLFILAEKENATGADRGGGGGEGEGGGGKGGELEGRGTGDGRGGERGGEVDRRGKADRTLRTRLSSVFTSTLDCPNELPLTFLGMGDQTVDLSKDPACPWIKTSVRNADNNFVALGYEMAVLRDVVLDPSKFRGTLGGEEIASVFGQKEGSEYFDVQRGFFSLPCKAPPKDVKFHVEKQNYRRSNHLNNWLSSIVCRDESKSGQEGGLVAAASNSNTNTTTNNNINNTTNSSSSNNSKGAASLTAGMMDVSQGYVPGVTLALQRYEYANLYHTMLDWYNAFISLLILGIDPRAATFLLVDGHPWGKLDPSWATMFGGRSVLRAGHLPGETRFEYMVWVPNGYHCPLFETARTQVPFLPQLREHFFRSYGVQASNGPQCKRLRMLLIRRRDYLAHPRNPRGVLQRKIANEDEILEALKKAFPDHQIRAEQLDLLPMKKQLQIIGETDILVGMHGAALTYTLLLAKGAALVEMYPKYAGRTSLLFKQIAAWRGVHYIQWMNNDSKNEKPNMFTYIPTSVVTDMVKKMLDKMCPA